MSRAEFTKATKRLALQRAQGKCEAIGEMYGLVTSTRERCGAPLSNGVEFDHVLAASNGGDASSENCLAVCKACHLHKTRYFDTPRAAKTLRQQDKNRGIRKKSTMPGSRNSPWKQKINGKVERRT